jgi:hypothetical protein
VRSTDHQGQLKELFYAYAHDDFEGACTPIIHKEGMKKREPAVERRSSHGRVSVGCLKRSSGV